MCKEQCFQGAYEGSWERASSEKFPADFQSGSKVKMAAEFPAFAQPI